MTTGNWRIRHRPEPSLPAMAWVARISPPDVDLRFGSGVRASDAGIFEGTWVGDADSLGPLRSTTPFGSGVLVEGGAVYLVSPGHMLEGIYWCYRGAEMVASNSLTGLLTAAGAELDPDIAYPALFNQSVNGVMHTSIPTLGGAIETCFHDNLRVDLDGRSTAVPKPREDPIADFGDYRARLSAALGSAISNGPAGDMAVTISSGYDGAAVAVLAAELGCRRAVTIADGKPVRGSASLSDSGEDIGRRLGMEVSSFERLAYQRRDDLPEAAFLANGFSGEEVVFSQMEQELQGKVLVSAFEGDAMWWMNRPPRPSMWRSDQSGSSLGEWRLRVGFTHVPLPSFAAYHHRVTRAIGHSAEMRPWVLGKSYDKPIPRRILEEAGVPRDMFGVTKRAASGTIHTDGPAALAPATRAAIEHFARSEGRTVSFRRRRRGLLERAGLRITRRLGLEPIAAWIERGKIALAVMEPVFGSLCLRWAVSVTRPRYAAVAPTPNALEGEGP